LVVDQLALVPITCRVHHKRSSIVISCLNRWVLP
jgi:hypothetical protein